MASQQNLELLQKGIPDWNTWRENHPEIVPDLSRADLTGADLMGADLSGAILSGVVLMGAILSMTDLSRADLMGVDLSGATLSGADLSFANLSFANLMEADLIGAQLRKTDLREANLMEASLMEASLMEANLRAAILSRANLSRVNLSFADLMGANLSRADLSRADLRGANLSFADLSGANFMGAHLMGAHLSRADLSGANFMGAHLMGAHLSRATLVGTNLTQANLTDCQIYGISAWDIQLEEAIQNNLIITPKEQPTITVDNLEVAQFIYLLLNNPKIRDVIDTIAKKAVLILGSFTSERKPVLEAIRTALRSRGYLPILFDFEKPDSQDVTETVSTLAHLSRFILVDLTDPSCSPYEIGIIAHNHIKPIQPLFQPSTTAQHEFAMLKDLRYRHYWILPTYEYSSLEGLLTSLGDKIITPAEQKLKEIATRRTSEEVK